jgi:hypothetical protein
MSGGLFVCSGVAVAEHEMTRRATTAKPTQIDFTRRGFEVRDIAQRYTAIRGLNIMRWGLSERK